MITTRHCLVVYKNFCSAVSHIGLGVAALNNAKVLNENRIITTVIPANFAADIEAYLARDPSVTHVVISAPWIPINDLANLVHHHPRITFAVNYHSNVAFLRADTRGIELLREYIHLDLGTVNFFVAGNSPRFVTFIQATFAAPCAFLGNMYHLTHAAGGHSLRGATRGQGTLRIGSFGAPRIQKNMLSSAAAAIEIAQELHRDVEFFMNSGREDAGVIRTVRALLESVPGATLHLVPWSTWPAIRHIVRRMDVLISSSYTESFSMVTADGISEGVPSVVSEAIYWAPENWKVSADNVPAIACAARGLIGDPRASHDGLIALERQNERALSGWSRFLKAPRIYRWKYLAPEAS